MPVEAYCGDVCCCFAASRRWRLSSSAISRSSCTRQCRCNSINQCLSLGIHTEHLIQVQLPPPHLPLEVV
jgi:hypothetical protein